MSMLFGLHALYFKNSSIPRVKPSGKVRMDVLDRMHASTLSSDDREEALVVVLTTPIPNLFRIDGTLGIRFQD